MGVGPTFDESPPLFTVSVSEAVPRTTEFGFSLWLVTVIVWVPSLTVVLLNTTFPGAKAPDCVPSTWSVSNQSLGQVSLVVIATLVPLTVLSFVGAVIVMQGVGVELGDGVPVAVEVAVADAVALGEGVAV